MRRARFAFVLIACAGGLVSGACGPDLPERMWQSANVRYFSRATDDTVCPAILAELEEHGAVIADVFGIGRTTVSYYKFDGADDYDKNAACPAGAAACAPNATVRSVDGFDRHELIHAYLAPYGRPPPLLSEGVAVALTCRHAARPIGSWRDAYGADRLSSHLYDAGGWLVGYLLRMFRATWLVNFYGSVGISATPDEFAAVFKDIYKMSLDDVWAAAITVPQTPRRCPWECGARSALALDGQPHPLAPVCGAGQVQLALDLPAGDVTRWRIDGDAQFSLGSCDGNDEPIYTFPGGAGTGELLAPLGAGKYFVDAMVWKGAPPALAVGTGTPADLSSIDCASAPAVPDDLAALANLALFYPSSLGPRFTRFATGTDRAAGVMALSDDDHSAPPSLCASCDLQTCSPIGVGRSVNTDTTPAGTVLYVPPGPALTVSFYWL